MNEVVKTMLIAIVLNVVAGALIFLASVTAKPHDNLNATIGAFIIIGAGLLIQLIVGLIMAGDAKWKKTGQGMLLAVGIILVIGFAVCSAIIH